jgi:hypothetical protein
MNLEYVSSEGRKQIVQNVSVYQGKCGRWWIWSEEMAINLAYKEKSLDDALKSAIDSLLFTIQLKDERIKELQVISEAVDAFVQKVTKESE